MRQIRAGGRCAVTSDRLADAVQVYDVGVGSVDLAEVLLDLTVAVITKLKRPSGNEEEEEEEG